MFNVFLSDRLTDVGQTTWIYEMPLAKLIHDFMLLKVKLMLVTKVECGRVIFIWKLRIVFLLKTIKVYIFWPYQYYELTPKLRMNHANFKIVLTNISRLLTI